MANIYVPNPEELGRRRFPDNKGFRKDLAGTASDILSLITSLFPSNYPKDPSTNLSLFNNVTAREAARLNLSMGAINSDKQWFVSRVRYLQQILGERLFLSSRLAPASYNDESYREYLLAVKNAYLLGSKKSNIEAIASAFTGQKITIKELYLVAREPGSSLDVTSTHKMVVDVFVDDLLRSGLDMQMLMNELTFFINLVRPAHVLYDTRFIWSEQFDINKVIDLFFGDTGGGCVPVYDFLPLDEPTWLARQIFILDGPTGSIGQIDSIHPDDLLFYLSDSTKVITEPGVNGTNIYQHGRRVTFNALEIGQYVFINYLLIPGDFQFWWTPLDVLSDPISRFYRDVYRKPAFQEFVKKVMDAHGRFPLQTKTTPTTICDRWVQDAMQPLYEDMRRQCIGGEHNSEFDSTVHEKMGFPRFSWPYPNSEIHDDLLLGDYYIFGMPNSPLTDGTSSPATINDVSIRFDGTTLPNAVSYVDASSARIEVVDSEIYWDSTVGRFPMPGDEFTFGYHYLNDGTNYDASSSYVFGIAYWQTPHVPVVAGNGNGDLAVASDMTVAVDGTFIPGAVSSLDSLLGHITLHSESDFWLSSALGRLPQIGDVFEFSYKWGENYQYSLIFDDPGRVFDSYRGVDSYGMVFDADLNSNPEVSAVIPPTPVEVGYRWRTYLLHHSSVLNSPSTLTLNTYQKPANRASIANQMDVLNHFNKVFSPEFLYDQNPVDVKHLDDPYLENGLDPVLKLKEGTPPFQKTFWSHHGLIYHQKVQDIRQHHHPLIYSDLLIKEFRDSGDSVPLNSICDSNRVSFKIRLGEDTIPPIQECSPWILFDTLETKDLEISIPGEMRGVPNLRIPGINLRDNFILRNIEEAGTAVYTYTIHTPIGEEQTVFQLPQSFEYSYQGETFNFPAIPIMKNETELADVNDIQVKLNGIMVPGIVQSLDPINGIVEIYHVSSPYRIEDYITLTESDIASKQVMLSGFPSDPQNIALTVIRGSSQYLNEDFVVDGRFIVWRGSDLDGSLQAGDELRVAYFNDPFVNLTIEFTYRILNSHTFDVVDEDRSRILDNGYVFDGGCPDGNSVIISNSGATFNEYINFLDDFSSGIKVAFLNTDTNQIEEHVFSGPLFEYYDARDDQIGSPENFPNSLVRIRGPISSGNILNDVVDYGFTGDRAVRFRKKTFQELLPNRTFRTIKLTEMLPI
jgi:hypothetical protein